MRVSGPSRSEPGGDRYQALHLTARPGDRKISEAIAGHLTILGVGA